MRLLAGLFVCRAIPTFSDFFVTLVPQLFPLFILLNPVHMAVRDEWKILITNV